jgi:hypothetical protein
MHARRNDRHGSGNRTFGFPPMQAFAFTMSHVRTVRIGFGRDEAFSLKF